MAGVFRSPVAPVQVDLGNTINYIFAESAQWNHKPALVCGDTKRSLTFKELQVAVGRWGAWLNNSEHFTAKTTTVAARMGASLDLAVMQLGTIAQGGIFTTIVENYKPVEIARQIGTCNVGLVVVSEENESSLREAFTILGKSLPVVTLVRQSCGPTVGCLADILSDDAIAPAMPAQLTGNEMTFIVYTSGTSGLPKGVCHPHSSLINNVAQAIHPTYCTSPKTTDTTQYRTLLCRDFGIAYGLVAAFLPSLKLGVCQVVKKESEKTIIQDIAEHKVNQLHIVPPTLTTILRIPAECPSILTHLDRIFLSGAPTPAVHERALKATMPGVLVQQCYGSSEMGLMTLDPVTGGKPGYTGQLLPNTEVKILDINTRKPLQPNENGVIFVRTKSCMNSYLNNVEATRAVLDSDGWFNTGDIGHVDEDSFLMITDREKDIILGPDILMISPSELENALLADVRVTEACVLGIRTPQTSIDTIVTFVSVADKEIATEQYVKDIIARDFGKPKHLSKVLVMDKLPRNVSNKIDRKMLRDQANELYSSK